MKSFLVTLAFFALYSCTYNKDEKSTKKIADTTITAAANNKGDSNTCIFDTSVYKFTTEDLRAYDPKISFTWNDQYHEAIVKLDKNDTLRLHVGGCESFFYSAVYTTDSSLFQNDSLLINKAKWIAKTFFTNGFGDKYISGLTNNHYEIDRSQPRAKTLTISDKDTVETNMSIEPITFRIEDGRTTISLLSSMN